MKLLFKQRFFSWFDSYDVYDEQGNTLFTVEGKPSWGHRLHILDSSGETIGAVKEVIFAFLPRFDLFVGDRCVGFIKKEFTFLKPKFSLDMNGWTVQGNLFEWDYYVADESGNVVATISKEIIRWTDTYSIDIADPSHALMVLMIVLAIDAEKCERS